MNELRKPRGSFVLKALPVLAGLAWLVAVALAVTRLNPWVPGSADRIMVLYGWIAPDAVVFALMAASIACAVMAVWRPHLAWPYAAGAFIVPLGTGAKGLVGAGLLQGDLLPLMAFATAVFLFMEYLSAVPRFQIIVQSTAGMDQSEVRPVAVFLGRYLGLSILLVLAYGVLLMVWVQYLVPALAGTFSARVADGLENRTALGVITFTALLLLLLFIFRFGLDGIQMMRAAGQDEDEETDIIDLEPVKVAREVKS